MFGLVSEKKWAKADAMWVTTLNHISLYLMNKNTDLKIKKNLIKLLILVDPDGKELIENILTDWKSKKITKEYKSILNVICPIIIKEQKKVMKGNN